VRGSSHVGPVPGCSPTDRDLFRTVSTDSTTEGQLAATGAWLPGDPVGHRSFRTIVDERVGRRFQLEGGGHLARVEVAFETWGTLDADGSNAVLVCHALTGDSHLAGRAAPGHPTPGWWDALVGPGRALDTDRYFVVCSNVLGGCQGTTGPASVDPDTGRPYGSSFPVVSIRDMVRVQAALADALGIGRWRAVVGGSMGGMQALEWGVMYPGRVGGLVLASTTAEASAQQIAWSHIGRMAIQADPRFRGGDYYGAAPGDGPHRGLAVARMCAQVTYRSDEVFTERFHRTLINRMDFTLDPLFDVEGYLDYHGLKLARRFDANSYVRLNRAMDLHDVGRGRGGVAPALGRVDAPSIVSAVRSDGLYPPAQQRALHEGLLAAGTDSRWVDIDSPHGHDGFLLETGQFGPHLARFLAALEPSPPFPPHPTDPTDPENP
jgi:homoserine O-acetyltransferase/O-succinyltransferase